MQLSTAPLKVRRDRLWFTMEATFWCTTMSSPTTIGWDREISEPSTHMLGGHAHMTSAKFLRAERNAGLVNTLKRLADVLNLLNPMSFKGPKVPNACEISPSNGCCRSIRSEPCWICFYPLPIPLAMYRAKKKG